MKSYTKKNARYRGIPCWWNPITDELVGKNWFYDKLISVVIWIDINIVEVEEFPLWVEVDELEKKPKTVTACYLCGESVLGITEGKIYVVRYEGKDEIGIVNDFGQEEEYSKNCFTEYYG